MVYFVCYVCFASKMVCLLRLFWACQKTISTRPFLECFLTCFIEYHWYEFMISLLEVMHQITLGMRKWSWNLWWLDHVTICIPRTSTHEHGHGSGELWRSLRHGGYIVTETQAGKKHFSTAASRRSLGDETICKPIYKTSIQKNPPRMMIIMD